MLEHAKSLHLTDRTLCVYVGRDEDALVACGWCKKEVITTVALHKGRAVSIAGTAVNFAGDNGWEAALAVEMAHVRHGL